MQYPFKVLERATKWATFQLVLHMSIINITVISVKFGDDTRSYRALNVLPENIINCSKQPKIGGALQYKIGSSFTQ